MMTINKYEVYEISATIEQIHYSGNSIKDAVNEARLVAGTTKDPVEIRMNIDEMDGGINFDTVSLDDEKEQAEADAKSMRWMRAQTGMTRKEFCDKYGIPYRTMQDWEDGKSKPVEWAETLLRRAVREDLISAE